LITVIIPAYNRAAFLQEAIPSVLGQTYFAGAGRGAWELIIVDDGSEDGTKALAASFDGPIRYERQEHKGVSAARNAGLRLARGEWIAFLDSDDLWKLTKISAQMEFMAAHPEAPVCLTEEIWIRRGVRVNPRRKHKQHSGRIFDKVLPICLLSLSSALFRREVFDDIGMFDENLPACEDYDFGIRLAFRYPVHVLPEPLIIKRGGHADQLSHQYWGMDRFRVYALEKSLSLGLSAEEERLVRDEIVKKSRILRDGFRKRGNRAEAEKYEAIIERMGKAVPST
jgi:glycosyltransferase involved in cell wall biosynthesis